MILFRIYPILLVAHYLLLSPIGFMVIIEAHTQAHTTQEAQSRIANDMYNQEEFTIKKRWDFIAISLGCNCTPALYTRSQGIRDCALPFDWCLTPYQALYEFIRDNFNNYLKKEHLIASAKYRFSTYLRDFLTKLDYMNICETPTWVLDIHSGMIYNHDFPNNLPSTIDLHYAEQHAKYLRRIKRFYTEVNSGKHIYFIRYLDITKTTALELYQLLKDKFPQVPFTLIVVGNDRSEFSRDWGIPHLKNFFVQKEDVFWQYLCKSIVNGILR